MNVDWNRKMLFRLTQLLYISVLISPFFPPVILLFLGLLTMAVCYRRWELVRVPESIFLGFIGITLISWLHNPSWFYGIPTGLIVGVLFGLYYLLSLWFRSVLQPTWVEIQKLYITFWLGGLYVAAIVLIQQVDSPLINESFLEPLLQFYREFRWQTESVRSFGTAGNSNLTAALLICFALMSIYATSILQKRWHKLAAIGIFGIYCLSIWATGSRGAWVGLVIGLVVQVWMTGQRMWTVGLSLALCGLVVFFPDLIPRQDTLMYTLKDRLHIWITSFDLFQEHWLLGTLPLNFGELFQQQAGFYVYHAHNILLGMATEFGIFGFMLFLYLVLVTIQRARRWRKVANKKEEKRLAGMLLSQIIALMGHGMYDYPILSPQVGVVFMMGIIIIHNQFERRCLWRPSWSRDEKKPESKLYDFRSISSSWFHSKKAEIEHKKDIGS